MEKSLGDFVKQITSKEQYNLINHSYSKKIMNSFLKKKNNSNIHLIIIKILIIYLSLQFIYFAFENSIKYNHFFNTFYLKNLALDNGKDLTLKISYLDYSYSLTYNITEVKYCINFYDEYNNPILPTTLSLNNFQVICHMKSIVNNINFESIANIYENKYFFCIEYFNIGEKVTFGIKIYNTKSTYNKKYKDVYYFIFQNNKFNFKNKEHKNDSKFDPLLINEEYTALKNKILSLKSSYQGKANETIILKRSYIIRPVCNPKTRIKVLKNNWTFKNIYNQYFCFCKGESCFSKKVIKESQRCKYNFYLSIIDNNRYLYNKTDYLLSDFLYKELSADDAYPIFKEMIKRNLSAHYITRKRNIYKKYCKSNRQCQIIIKDVNINGDFLEKYLELILRLKAVIVGSDLKTMDFIFYNIEYITSINLGHGVKFFKSFLYRNYTSPQKYNKLVLAPSKKLIAVALKYGWKEENIIKICLPKWDKYYTTKKGKRIYQSIFIFFTWRNLREKKKISSEYINNIFKLINSNILKKKLKKKNISLYYTLHPGIALYTKNLIINNLKSKYITLEQISDTLMKSNLLITDFSSVTFDFIFQRKPIINIPDSEDPNNKYNYDDDYYNLINSMKNETIHFENRCNNVEQVINKIIYYIDNDFNLESNLEKFYDSFEFKCKNNTQSFIEYIKNMT